MASREFLSEFVEGAGFAEMKMQGFADTDVEFTKQIIQLIGQQETGAQEIAKITDIKRLLEDSGTPIASFAEQKRREEEIAAQAAAGAPPSVAPVPGQQVGWFPRARPLDSRTRSPRRSFSSLRVVTTSSRAYRIAAL